MSEFNEKNEELKVEPTTGETVAEEVDASAEPTAETVQSDPANPVESSAESHSEAASAFVDFGDEKPTEPARAEEPCSFTPGAPYIAPNQPLAPAYKPVKVSPPEKVPNTGLRVFLILIAIVVALCIATTAGYMAGRNSGGAVINGSSALASIPENAEKTSAQVVYDNVKASTVGVSVVSVSAQKQAMGSGVIYSADGYIVTNDHLLSEMPAPVFFVTTCDGQEYEATYVASDTRSDLAVLKVEGTFTPATFGDSSQLRTGDEVLTIGYPGASTVGPILTTGTVSSPSRRVSMTNTAYSPSLIQTDAAINPGSSGGALVNMYSQVVGITSSKLDGTEYDRVGFAIPSATVKKVVDSLIANGKVVGRARLGISYVGVTSASSVVNNMPVGLYISSITSDSDLNNKGVVSGDVITHINDIAIKNAVVALDIIDSSKPGDVLTLTVIRTSTGDTFSVSAVLTDDPGTSSYTETATTAPSNDNSDDGYEFDFPFGN